MKFLLILLFGLSLTIQASAQTIPYFDSVPAMNGFTVMSDDILIFDKPEGQIVEVSLFCEEKCPNDGVIYDYYRAVFKNLGWQADDVMGFYKSGRAVNLELQKSMESPEIVILTFRSTT
jgi:hypothetical protein